MTEKTASETEPFSYWVPLVALAFFGFLAITGTTFIFVLGYNPSPVVWGAYTLNIITTLSFGGFLIQDWRKHHRI